MSNFVKPPRVNVGFFEILGGSRLDESSWAGGVEAADELTVLMEVEDQPALESPAELFEGSEVD